MAILVTGAAGFIGAAVAEALLRRGDAVIGVDGRVPYYSVALKEARAARLATIGAGRFTDLVIDFADAGALAAALRGMPVRRIIHLGAQPGVRWSIDHPEAYGRNNLVGHLNLLEVARARRVPMVYASSSSVYGAESARPFAVTARADRPLSLYAATKRAGELMAESYAHLYRLPLTGLRFFTVYGPWGRPDMAVWRFAEACLDGRPATLYNRGRMERDFTFIDDVVAAILACSDAPPADDGAAKPGGSTAPHAIYNVGNGHPEALPALVAAIEHTCGRPLECILAPMRPGDAPRTFADTSAIRAAHGFRPKVALPEGVAHFVGWLRDWRAGKWAVAPR